MSPNSRYAIVNDLCPGATHLSYNFNFPFDKQAFEKEVDDMAAAVEGECGWMYRTRHGKRGSGDVVCVLWSDVFICGNCGREIVFWASAVDLKIGEVSETVTCTHCRAGSKKSALDRAWSNEYDSALKRSVRQAKQVPVTVIYEVDGRRFEKVPDEEDIDIIRRISEGQIPYFFPSDRMPDGEESRRNDPLGITHVHHFFTKRNLWSLACAWHHAQSWRARFLVTSMLYRSSILCAPKMSNYFAEKKGKPRGGWIGTERSGTLYCPSIHSEVAIPPQIGTRRRAVQVTAASGALPAIGTASTTQIGLKDESVDYIFTDPPFGSNKMRTPMMSISHSDLMPIRSERSDAGLSQFEALIDIRQEFCLPSLS